MAAPKPALSCLVADDEPQIGTLLRDALARDGYVCDVVTDGDQAARKLAERDYSLVVSDILMPFKTGVEIVHELRARGQAVPVVLMSSFLSEEARTSCSAVEHVAFLQKPFGLDELRRAVERALTPARR